MAGFDDSEVSEDFADGYEDATHDANELNKPDEEYDPDEGFDLHVDVDRLEHDDEYAAGVNEAEHEHGNPS